MPHSARDPLHILCERIILPSRLDECVSYGHSKCARFHRRATKMKYWRRKINHNIYYWNNFNYSYDIVFLCPKSSLMENKLCLQNMYIYSINISRKAWHCEWVLCNSLYWKIFKNVKTQSHSSSVTYPEIWRCIISFRDAHPPHSHPHLQITVYVTLLIHSTMIIWSKPCELLHISWSYRNATFLIF
jgi:hypothetical protein